MAMMTEPISLISLLFSGLVASTAPIFFFIDNFSYPLHVNKFSESFGL